MQLINIDRATFEQLDPTRRIIDADHAHRSAIVHLEKWGDYGLGWNSELIEPSISTGSNVDRVIRSVYAAARFAKRESLKRDRNLKGVQNENDRYVVVIEKNLKTVSIARRWGILDTEQFLTVSHLYCVFC